MEFVLDPTRGVTLARVRVGRGQAAGGGGGAGSGNRWTKNGTDFEADVSGRL